MPPGTPSGVSQAVLRLHPTTEMAMTTATDTPPECDYEYHRANRWAIYDRFGIFYTYVCDRCEARKISPEQRAHLETYIPDEPLDDY